MGGRWEVNLNVTGRPAALKFPKAAQQLFTSRGWSFGVIQILNHTIYDNTDTVIQISTSV